MNDPCDSRRSSEGSEQDGSEPPSPAAQTIELDVVHEAGDWSSVPDIDNIIRRAAQAAATEPEAELAGASAALALSSDEHVATLNAAYRGKPSPTNVLSFPVASGLPVGSGAQRFIGDIVLAAETVAAEAAAMRIPTSHHLQHLVVHGLLHLVGFDHETDEEATRMEALETRILATLDIADPYAPIEADSEE
ncbi:rRNA maturation RNase YbeY [Filomicrobium sp.]|uniref:rRNA maturation RNase YbeY n=1 Tax=Filomicrobium sp. TaxID=2024831 RepID=UPI002585B6FA|nr:rRNA maturation RNase YbeY [Filomicrobium sp.]MCV0370047.1 rRNA maturation RNase YbeY [Filomicrobium sp.]